MRGRRRKGRGALDPHIASFAGNSEQQSFRYGEEMKKGFRDGLPSSCLQKGRQMDMVLITTIRKVLRDKFTSVGQITLRLFIFNTSIDANRGGERPASRSRMHESWIALSLS
ncbi:hypothetical protein EVAR_5321_1 [Eumeta japonica]|uniref:Uncharacterized protein n=1 Tax=Eumeta variegata TaxID=151549 RepID=A0A4C1TMU6_EUMVA|nr:hypothetical protein EVAR_5321_1 [Eumeta japonica]